VQGLRGPQPVPGLRAPLHARIAAQLRKLTRYDATDPDTRQAAGLTDEELHQAAGILRALPTWPTMSYQGSSGLCTALGGYALDIADKLDGSVKCCGLSACCSAGGADRRRGRGGC
jgi:hypothetical protein